MGSPKNILNELVLEQWSVPKRFLARSNGICVIMSILTAKNVVALFNRRVDLLYDQTVLFRHQDITVYIF